MTEPIYRQPRLLRDFSLPEPAQPLARRDFKLQLDRFWSPPSFSLELFQSQFLPQNGTCGLLRNNSAFGCTYLNDGGRETKLGMNLDTYPGGLGLSLKVFLNP